MVNSTMVPLGIQLETPRPSRDTKRLWFPTHGQTQAGYTADSFGSYAFVLEPNTNEVGKLAANRDRHSVLYRGDHAHFNTEDFRTWALFNIEEMKTRLIQYDKMNTAYYDIPAPNDDQLTMTDEIQYLVLRYYPYLYAKARDNNANDIGFLSPSTWYNASTGTIRVPKAGMFSLIQDIHASQNPALNMMCCDQLQLTLTPLNVSGWDLIETTLLHDQHVFQSLPKFHPSRQSRIVVELEMRYIPLNRPPKAY